MKARSMFAAALEALAEAHRDAGANRESINTMRAEKSAAESEVRRLTSLIETERKRRQEAEGKPGREQRLTELRTAATAVHNLINAAPEADLSLVAPLQRLLAAIEATDQDDDIPF